MTHMVSNLSLKSKERAAESRDRNLQDYSAMMQHEFRCPLSTCLMFLSSLMNQQLADDVLKILKIVMSQLQLTLNLTNGLLDIRMLKQGKFSKQLELFNPI